MLGCLTLTPAMDIAIETDASAAFDGNLNPLGIDFGIALQCSFDLVLYISRLDAGLNGDAIDPPRRPTNGELQPPPRSADTARRPVR